MKIIFHSFRNSPRVATHMFILISYTKSFKSGERVFNENVIFARRSLNLPEASKQPAAALRRKK